MQSFNDLTFDDAELTVTRAGKPINLTEREYRLASCLFANLARPLSREYLYERFWSHEEMVSSRPLDTHIYRLLKQKGQRSALAFFIGSKKAVFPMLHVEHRAYWPGFTAATLSNR